MNRSLRLLRPFRPPPLTSPLPRSALRTPAPPSLAPPLFQANLQLQLQLQGRSYASKKDEKKGVVKDGQKAGSAGTGARSSENPNVDQQNATPGAMEELRSIAQGVADIISGGGAQPGGAPANKDFRGAMGAMETSSHSHSGSVREDFTGITKSMITAVPKPVLQFGLAGTLPYLGTSVGTVFLAREASRATQGLSTFSGLDAESALESLHTLEHVQITYGAIILSFLGALHWGMEFSKLGGEQGYRRLILGTIPVLFAWPTTFLTHGVALAVQWMGFTGMWFIDQRASTNGWTTPWYSTYRFYLSIVVGFSIIGTLVGTGMYGAGAGAITDPHTHRTRHTTERRSSYQALDRVRKENYPQPGTKAGKVIGKVKGDIEIDENEDGEAYNRIRNIAKSEEQEREQEHANLEKQEAQDKKDEHQMDRSPGSMKSEASDRTGKNANMPGGEETKEGGGEDGADGKTDEGDKQEQHGDVENSAEPKDEGGAAGKSQQNKSDPKNKGQAGNLSTGTR